MGKSQSNHFFTIQYLYNIAHMTQILRRSNINQFILFTILGLFGIGCCIHCPQTLGRFWPQEIEQEMKDSHKSNITDDIQLKPLHFFNQQNECLSKYVRNDPLLMNSYDFQQDCSQINSIMREESQKEDNQKSVQTYLDLIEKVGSKGKYQYILTLISGLSNYITGVVLMSTSFIFNNPEFDCEASGLLTDQCYDYVCSLPKDQWATFVTEEGNKFRSLANQFQSYFCDDQFYLNAYSSAAFFGTLVGSFIIAMLADNLGRRTSCLVANSIIMVGCLTLIFSQNLWMASLGLVCLGLCDSVYGTFASIQAECFSDYLRQKIGTVIQSTFIFGALSATLFYYLFQSWLITSIYVLAIPSFINSFLFFWFVKETPMFLARQSPEKALKQLNQIGYMNKKQKNILSLKDIQRVMECQQTVKNDVQSSPLDLFRYKSLRTLSLALLGINISTAIMYYGPTLIIDQIGFDMYTSQTVLNIADLFCYYPLMVMIDKVRRRRTTSILFGIATLMSFFLSFINKPDNCDGCSTAYIQLAFIFVFRFAISMQFGLLLLYMTELYPIRVRNISAGVISVFSGIASTVSPIIMGELTRANINHFILFTILGLFGVGCCIYCPQTLGRLCPQQIEEIQLQKLLKDSDKSNVTDDLQH